jgi:hypothetical protein
MVQWRNHGKHHARVSAREEITLPYVAVPALEEAFAFIIMACELYACIFGFGLWLAWLGGIIFTYLLFFGCEGIWYVESLLGGMAMRTCGDERRGDLYVWLLRDVVGRDGGGWIKYQVQLNKQTNERMEWDKEGKARHGDK